jgi:stearoyl-CoA desaturase (delta-9 desaturase)
MENTAKPAIQWLPASVLIGTPLIAAIGVPWYGLSHGFSLSHWLVFAFVLGCNGLAITAGYHRLWAHNTYKAHSLLKWFLALFGAGATQNSILVWASGHRRHHRHVDDDELDPYSAGRGFWFSHIGWMLRDHPASRENFSNVPDLERDPVVAFQHRHYVPLAIGMNLLPPIVAGLLLGDFLGHLLLAGFLRLVVNHHVTFFINSLAHIWGRQPYTDGNTARDNFWLALVTYGEGYHNFHHIFQTDYRNGVRWWQFDPTKWLIYGASKLGLARNLSRVPNFKIQQALLDMQFQRAEQRLKDAANAEAWREHLEREYQQFLAHLQEWNTLRQQWYDQKRAQWAEKTAELQRKLQQNSISSRIKELEYALRQQRKRLRYLTLQFA